MENIKKLRIESGLSLRMVEKLTGIGFSYLCKLEKNTIKLTPNVIRTLSDFYSVDSTMITDLNPYIVYITFNDEIVPLSDFEYEKYKNCLCTTLVDGRIKRTLKKGNNEQFIKYLQYRNEIDRQFQHDFLILNSLNTLSHEGLLKAKNIISKLLEGEWSNERKTK